MKRKKYKHIAYEETRHGKPVIYFRINKGTRIRLPDDIDSIFFNEAYMAALHEQKTLYRPTKITKAQKIDEESIKIIRKAVSRAKLKCTKNSIPFDLDSVWAIEKLTHQNFRCELSGKNFTPDNTSTSFMRPFIPSLDRIDPRKGYTKNNVRIVTFAMNAMLSDWGEFVFRHTARGYLKNVRRTNFPRT